MFACLKGKGTDIKEGAKIFHPLFLIAPKWPKDRSQEALLGLGPSSAALPPSQVHQQGAQWEAEQPGLKLVLTQDASSTG